MPQTDKQQYELVKQIIPDPTVFAEYASKLKLRKYQADVVRAIVASIIAKAGLSFVVMFPRQSGKNETQAQLETYLLTICIQFPVSIVKVSPTWKPQAQNAMDRLQRTLESNILVKNLWRFEASIIFF